MKRIPKQKLVLRDAIRILGRTTRHTLDFYNDVEDVDWMLGELPTAEGCFSKEKCEVTFFETESYAETKFEGSNAEWLRGCGRIENVPQKKHSQKFIFCPQGKTRFLPRLQELIHVACL